MKIRSNVQCKNILTKHIINKLTLTKNCKSFTMKNTQLKLIEGVIFS